MFLFCGISCDRIKCLLWERDGFLLLYKRLGNGRFHWSRNNDELRLIDDEQYAWLMKGLSVDPGIYRADHLMNHRYFGRKTEKSSSYEQLSLFLNETEVIHEKEENEEEPEVKTVVVRKRPKGKKESDLAKITNHRDEYIRIPEEELDRRFGVIGWKNCRK